MDENFRPLRTSTQNKSSSSSVTSTQNLNYDVADRLRDQYFIEVDGENIPHPITTFEQMNLPRKVLDYILRRKKI